MKPDAEQLQSEIEVFEVMTAGYVGSIVRAAKSVPGEKWNWSFSPQTPSAREICEHTFVWLWCDRQQMAGLDRAQHRPTPTLPENQEAMIRLLMEEAAEWRRLVRALKPEDLDQQREPWPGETRNIRSFLFHMGQHVIYKAGQMWMLAFGMELDGSGPYSAPYPNEMYGFKDQPVWPSPRE